MLVGSMSNISYYDLRFHLCTNIFTNYYRVSPIIVGIVGSPYHGLITFSGPKLYKDFYGIFRLESLNKY
jgi:hypothetical protein